MMADDRTGPGRAGDGTDLDEQCQGYGRMCARTLAALVHPRFGIVNEVYYPRVDVPQIRDLGFIIADGEGFWAEVRRVADYRLRLLAPGVPAVEVVHQHERYSLRLRIAPDERRDMLAIECSLDGDPKLRVYALLAPHLGATGYGNRAAVVLQRRRRTLWAEQRPFGSALASVDEIQRDAVGRAPQPHDFRRCCERAGGFRGVGEVGAVVPLESGAPPAPAIPTRWASRGGLWRRNRPSAGGGRSCSKLRCRGQRTGSIKCS